MFTDFYGNVFSPGAMLTYVERHFVPYYGGHKGRQPPYDAFWGARYAIVADPDGNDVGLMSPLDEKRRTWPPTESTAP